MANRSIARSMLFAAALLAGPWGATVGQEASSYCRSHSSRANTWRSKLKSTATTVAAMKRAARKSRNRSKRNG